jgi:hypothetical protein
MPVSKRNCQRRQRKRGERCASGVASHHEIKGAEGGSVLSSTRPRPSKNWFWQSHDIATWDDWTCHKLTPRDATPRIEQVAAARAGDEDISRAYSARRSQAQVATAIKRTRVACAASGGRAPPDAAV